MKHTGSCFCGAVEVQVTGAPEGMGYCHCSSCRSWSGGPVNAFTLWKPEAVRITAGAQHVATFEKTPMSQRKYCAECGGHLMTNHPTLGLVDVFAATLPTLAFTPGIHVTYVDRIVRADRQTRRLAQTLPLVDELAFLIHNDNSLILAVRDQQASA